LFCFLAVLGFWTQGLMLARQMLYYLSYSPAFLLLLFFGQGFIFLSGAPSDGSPPTCASQVAWDYRCAPLQPACWLTWISRTFCSGWPLN
jgi:hypothetical protein